MRKLEKDIVQTDRRNSREHERKRNKKRSTRRRQMFLLTSLNLQKKTDLRVFICFTTIVLAKCVKESARPKLIEGNDYETRQKSLLYVNVIVLFFWPWSCTKHNSCLLRTEELTNRNVLVT